MTLVCFVVPITIQGQAHATEFLRGLERGIHTTLGSRGSGLSGGQQQRVALARALFRNAPVLVLDEPTSAQDAHTAASIRESVTQQSRRGTTVILIAHDLKAAQVSF